MTTKNERYEALKAMLEDGKRIVLQEMLVKMREVRAEGADNPRRAGGTTEVESQEDFELALIQMRADTLKKINEALACLEAGRYGLCKKCGYEITQARLRALLFAVRCKDCEEEHEMAELRRRVASRHHTTVGPLGL